MRGPILRRGMLGPHSRRDEVRMVAVSVEIPTGADLLSVAAVPGIHLLLYYIWLLWMWMPYLSVISWITFENSFYSFTVYDL